MLHPITLTSPDRISVERLWAFLVADEMESGSETPQTPVEARGQALARLESTFAASFPGQSLPFEIRNPAGATEEMTEGGEMRALPGGIRASDNRIWIIVAKPEDTDATMFPDDPLTYEDLDGVARSYDRRFRQASIIQPLGDGAPAHFTGEHTTFLPGVVDAVQFDGYHLWVLARSIGSAIPLAVRWGAHQRSIGMWRRLPDLPDNPPYLRHVAILTGEPPGIPNMPPLTEFVASDTFQELLREDVVRQACQAAVTDTRPSQEFIVRSIPDITAEGGPMEQTKDTNNKAVTPDDTATRSTKDDGTGATATKPASERDQGTKSRSLPEGYFEDLDSVLQRALETGLADPESTISRALKGLLAKPATTKPATTDGNAGRKDASSKTPEPVGIDSLRAAISEVVGPIVEKVEALGKQITTERSTQRQARIEETLNRAVAEMRLMPSDRDSYARLLVGADEETVDKTLAEIEARSAIPMPGGLVMYDDEQGTPLSVPSFAQPIPGTNRTVADLEGVRATQAALKESRKHEDPESQRRAFRASLAAAYGHASASDQLPAFMQ